MNHRTRIKICGLSRTQDVQVAVDAGADAIGLVFYSRSPRHVTPDTARKLIAAVPPYVTSVGLFVNASESEVADIVAAAPISLIQFHGDETLEQCCSIAARVNRPFTRALRVQPGMTEEDLLKYEHDYRAASSLFAGLLLDAFVDGYGGGGKVFDWSLIPKELAPRVVLSGGLSAQNAADAIVRVRPYAVDVSSGVELSKGMKDPARIRAFIEAVRLADTIAASLNE
ncbi:phosphoribosylanthranilate isomerase [Noviherbaspirillum cavernae]|uniref:N-(5'-phosphoribosyl)anthranilate isomerase n=1 Tax=Noviherbaspirillum cavernae TaxID=2320862 RepID=A0A418X1V7_9BURK|nr:phosphoribosylanthranilate isomerase [Noviherbaspirillum cavernae]RJG06415.1 phosphoribosylanthranilate isomerase [Noviherbaspirillum cavernae]